MPAVFPDGSTMALRSTYTGYYSSRLPPSSPTSYRAGLLNRSSPTYTMPSWEYVPWWYDAHDYDDIGEWRSPRRDRFISPSSPRYSPLPSAPIHSTLSSPVTHIPSTSRLLDLPTTRSKYEMDCRYLPSPTWRTRLGSSFGRYMNQWRVCRGNY